MHPIFVSSQHLSSAACELAQLAYNKGNRESKIEMEKRFDRAFQ
jgi:hypothetical protein